MFFFVCMLIAQCWTNTYYIFILLKSILFLTSSIKKLHTNTIYFLEQFSKSKGIVVDKKVAPQPHLLFYSWLFKICFQVGVYDLAKYPEENNPCKVWGEVKKCKFLEDNLPPPRIITFVSTNILKCKAFDFYTYILIKFNWFFVYIQGVH